MKKLNFKENKFDDDICDMYFAMDFRWLFESWLDVFLFRWLLIFVTMFPDEVLWNNGASGLGTGDS